MEKVEWAGCVLGLIGAFVLACNQQWSGWGFVAFLASNVCWIIWGLKRKANAILAMQAGFTLTSITGIMRWIV